MQPFDEADRSKSLVNGTGARKYQLIIPQRSWRAAQF